MLEQLADAALKAADDRPRRALVAARSVQERAADASDHRAASAAARAVGLAHLHLHDVDHAVAALTVALAEARSASAPELEGRARMTLAAALSQSGRLDEALREAERAVVGLAGLDQARARAQRGLVQAYLGDGEGALRSFAEAEPVLRGKRDEDHLLSALLNRGALELQHGDLTAAARDLGEAIALSETLGRDLQAGYAHANLSLVCVGRGQVLDALDHLAAAESAIRRRRGAVGPLLTIRGELLLSVRLLTEARQTAMAALRAAIRSHDPVSAADTRVLLAQIAMLERRPSEAERWARAAERGAQENGQRELAAFARLQALRATLARGARRLPPLEDVAALVEMVSSAGWASSRVEARIVAAEIALRHGARGRKPRHAGVPAEALRFLDEAASHRRTGPATVRARAWYAEARRRELLDDRTGAVRASITGLRVLDEFAQSLGASDLRAYAAGQRTELAELGLRRALSGGQARAVLLWAERGRASVLQLPRPHPPDDPVLSELLAQLRRAAVEVDELQRAGEPSEQAIRRQVRLEARVRDHVRRKSRADLGEPLNDNRTGASLPVELRDALGDRALVEYVVLDGEVHAVTLVAGRCRLHHLGALAPVTDLLLRVPFALHRMLRGAADPRSAAASAALAKDAGRRLDALLLEPLPEVRGRDLVLVPTGPLQAVGWALLTSVADRSVTVSPAAGLWASAMTRPYAGGTVAVVAGPRLAGADAEARAVAAIHGVDALTADRATASATAHHVSRAGLCHLAAHARLSPDAPLFSSFTLADGPLYVHDLERVARLPHTVVLAACDAGRNAVLAGDELLGLSAAFLGGGSAQLVAPVVRIPDHETGALMVALHRELRAGSRLADALATVQRQFADESPAAFAAASAFVCLGAGFLPPPRASVATVVPAPRAGTRPAPGVPSARKPSSHDT